MPIEYQSIAQIAPYQFRSEHELLNEINRLIYQFNLQRDQIAEAYRDDKAISAYLYYFFATNVPKLEACFRFLSPEVIESLSNLGLIDFGAGPGTLSYSWLNYFPHYQKEITIVERNKAMLTVAKKLLAEKSNISFHSSVPAVENACLAFAHSFNELPEGEFEQLVKTIAPAAVLFIEPGTKECFAKIKEARSFLISKGYEIEYPCFSKHSCPMKEEDWCHQYLKLEHHVSIERLTQKLKRDRRVVPIIFHLYRKRKNPVVTETAVVLATYKPLKFGYEFDICFENIKLKVQILKKSLDKATEKQVKEYKAGEVISFERDKELGQDYFRIKLKKNSYSQTHSE